MIGICGEIAHGLECKEFLVHLVHLLDTWHLAPVPGGELNCSDDSI